MNSTTVLVTGATGFIGRHLVPALIDAGFDVRGQYRKHQGENPGVDWRRFDFDKEADLRSLVHGCKAVIHLAAEIADPRKMDRLNVDITRALAKTAVAQGVSYFGHASSIVVYGSPRHADVDESTSLIDTSSSINRQYSAEPYMLEYARTKSLGEMALLPFISDIQIDIMRPSVVVDSHGYLQPIHWKTARRALHMHRRTQYVHVGDVVAALVFLLRRGIASGKTGFVPYNICDDRSGTYQALFAVLLPREHLVPMLPRGLVTNLDLAKDMIKHRRFEVRYPLGLLNFGNKRLRETGFAAPIGWDRALAEARALAASERKLA